MQRTIDEGKEMTLLKVKNVFKQYGAHLVLEAADLEINEGK